VEKVKEGGFGRKHGGRNKGKIRYQPRNYRTCRASQAGRGGGSGAKEKPTLKGTKDWEGVQMTVKGWGKFENVQAGILTKNGGQITGEKKRTKKVHGLSPLRKNPTQKIPGL